MEVGEEMSKEKKRKVVEKNKEGLVYFEIWGILLIVLSFILLSELGPVGSSLNRFMKLIFGDFYWLTLLFVVYYGVMMIVKHQFISYSSLRIKGIIFLSIGLLMFSHYPIYNFVKPQLNESGSNLVALTYNQYMGYMENNNMQATFGGGIVGASALTLALMLIGELGSKITAFILLAAGISFLFEKTIYDFTKDLISDSKNITGIFGKKVGNVVGTMHKISKENKGSKTKKFLDEEHLEVKEAEPTGKPFIHLKEDNIPVEKKASYSPPNLKRLQYYDNNKVLEKQKDITLENAKRIKSFLKENFTSMDIEEIYIGPSISTFIIALKNNTLKNAFFNQLDGLYDVLGNDQIRVYLDYDEKQIVKIEIPNEFTYLISLKEVLDESHKEGVILGRDYRGEFYPLSFGRAFNVLTVGNDINSKIELLQMVVLQLTYLHTPDELAIAVFDSTKFELNEFHDLPHLFNGIYVDSPSKAKQPFISLYTELEYRVNGHHETKQPIIILLNDVTDFYTEDYQKYIDYLLAYGPKVNIFVMASTINLDDSLLSARFRSMFETIIAFQIKNKELSKRFVDTETHLLLKNGDCLINNKGERHFNRIQLITLKENDFIN
jgi:DNA segregation ATPase FtsK/SpoIIIE, S-DNA-T family